MGVSLPSGGLKFERLRRGEGAGLARGARARSAEVSPRRIWRVFARDSARRRGGGRASRWDLVLWGPARGGAARAR